jgi:hypothetical protein
MWFDKLTMSGGKNPLILGLSKGVSGQEAVFG